MPLQIKPRAIQHGGLRKHQITRRIPVQALAPRHQIQHRRHQNSTRRPLASTRRQYAQRRRQPAPGRVARDHHRLPVLQPAINRHNSMRRRRKRVLRRKRIKGQDDPPPRLIRDPLRIIQIGKRRPQPIPPAMQVDHLSLRAATRLNDQTTHAANHRLARPLRSIGRTRRPRPPLDQRLIGGIARPQWRQIPGASPCHSTNTPRASLPSSRSWKARSKSARS